MIPPRELVMRNQHIASECRLGRGRNEAQDFAAAIIVSATTWPYPGYPRQGCINRDGLIARGFYGGVAETGKNMSQEFCGR